MKIRRILLGASALTATGLVLVPNVASAHTADANPSCEGLHVSVAAFTDGVVTTITIDGDQETRSGNFRDTWEWDSTKGHTWRVVVDAVEDHYDQSFGGTEKACVSDTSSTQPPTTTTMPEVTTTMPEVTTTTAPGVTTSTMPEVTTTTAPEATTSTAPGVTTTTSPGSVGGVSGTTPQAPSAPRATSPARTAGTAGTAGTLPATGYGTGPLAAAGTVALLAGGAMLLAGRRRSAG